MNMKEKAQAAALIVVFVGLIASAIGFGIEAIGDAKLASKVVQAR